MDEAEPLLTGPYQQPGLRRSAGAERLLLMALWASAYGKAEQPQRVDWTRSFAMSDYSTLV
ncbi:MAG: hypothetical protein U5L03_15010 [Burkholderiaceae bacterium]|nr:hypothetical protein [Burkholderiaceae bacterium]